MGLEITPLETAMGFNTVVLLEGTPVKCIGTGIGETENWMRAQGAFSTDPAKAVGNDLVQDAGSLEGSIDLLATIHVLELLAGSFINFREPTDTQFGMYVAWDIIDEGLFGWEINKSLIQSINLTASENSATRITVNIQSFARDDWYKRQGYSWEYREGVENVPEVVTDLTQQIIPYWQTKLVIPDWVSPKDTLTWSITFSHNIEPIFLCENNTGPKAPVFHPPGALDVQLDFTVLLRHDDEPPLTLNSSQVVILDKSVTLPELKRVNRQSPMGDVNAPQLWSVSYIGLGDEPDFSLFKDFETIPASGLRL